MTGNRLGPFARILRHVVLMTLAVVIVAPFVWMVLCSFKTQSEILSAEIRLIPHTWAAVENYTAALTRVPMLRFLLNGVIVTLVIFLLQVLVNLPAAYALAKLRFRGRSAFLGLVLLCLLIPVHATAIPTYIMFYKAGLLNTYASLILPFTISVFGIFLMRQFFMTVPDDLIDAARVDGMSEIGYFWPLIVVADQALYTPPLGVAFFRLNDQGTSYGPLMAAATISIAPLVIAFLLAQRRFIEGITLTGMKA